MIFHVVVTRLEPELQCQRIDQWCEQLLSELFTAQPVQQRLVQARVMHDQHSSCEHVDDTLHGVPRIHSLADGRIGQAVHRSAVTDIAGWLDDMRFGGRQVDHPVADQYPADAEHVGGRCIQPRRFDIQADEFGLAE